jgi:thiamine transport system permease protein
VVKEMAGDFFLTTIWLIIINFSSILFLLVKLGSLQNFDFHSIQEPFFSSIIFTFNQAILSTIISLALGFLGAPGYSRLKLLKKPVRWILLFPSLMSPVLIILALLTSFDKFPFGMTGIIIGHAFLNAGLCTVWLGDAWNVIENKWAPVNFTLGGTPLKFFREVLWPQIRPVTLNLSAVVFSFCISSFAIPLVLGGSPQYSTLEVFIYERLRVAGDLSSAVLVGLVQSFMQFLVFLMVLKNSPAHQSRPSRLMMGLRPMNVMTIPTVILTGSILIPLFRIVQLGVPQWSSLYNIISTQQFLESAGNSLLVAFVIGLVTFLVLPLIVTFGVREFFLKIPALSGVVVGLGCLVVMNNLDINERTKFIVLLIYGHFCTLFIPILRLSWPRLANVRRIYGKVVLQLGASGFLTLRKVYLPLELKFFGSAAGLAAIWSMGEFSVSRILTGEYSTLPIFINNLISSYRLELASAVATLLLIITIASLTFFEVLNGLD